MSITNITYEFAFSESVKEVFNVEMDLQEQRIINMDSPEPPKWAELEEHKCSNCPLKAEDSPHCPLALNLVQVIDKFNHIKSYDRLQLSITLGSKEIRQETDAQTAISSLMGLLIATSGCPHTEFLKPMAHFHFPLATEEETLFRSTGSFLLKQYFEIQSGQREKFDLHELAHHYQELNTVNQGVSLRIRAASKADSTVNAIIMLDIFALIFPEAIEDSLKEIEYIFKN